MLIQLVLDLRLFSAFCLQAVNWAKQSYVPIYIDVKLKQASCGRKTRNKLQKQKYVSLFKARASD